MAYDDNGHGTCVAGILAGSGAASMGKYKGAAPGCHLVALKVLDRFGNGNKEDVLKAFEWILRNRQRYNIRIVNISVGTTYRTRSEQDVLVKGCGKAVGRRSCGGCCGWQSGAGSGKRHCTGLQQKDHHSRFQRHALGKAGSFRPWDRRLSVCASRIWWHRDGRSWRVPRELETCTA